MLRADHMCAAERGVIEAVAGAVLRADQGDLARSSIADPTIRSPVLRRRPLWHLGNGAGRRRHRSPSDAGTRPRRFADNGRAYAIVLQGDHQTPMPWVNVIANPKFGTIVTASGAANTWCGNSRETG